MARVNSVAVTPVALIRVPLGSAISRAAWCTAWCAVSCPADCAAISPGPARCSGIGSMRARFGGRRFRRLLGNLDSAPRSTIHLRSIQTDIPRSAQYCAWVCPDSRQPLSPHLRALLARSRFPRVPCILRHCSLLSSKRTLCENSETNARRGFADAYRENFTN